MDNRAYRFWRIVAPLWFLGATMTGKVRSLVVLVFGIVNYWYYWNRNAVGSQSFYVLK